MDINLFVIGDELLSGKRSDKHLSTVIGLLAARGMSLHAAEFLPDDEVRIAESIARVRERGEVLLSCGGIGGTPDDVTRQAAARAFGVDLERHTEGLKLLLDEYGAERIYPNRVRMIDFPAGAGLIPNPVNRVPGFFLDHCHFVPGFPEMAWPMLEWVLDQRLADLHRAEPDVEYRLRVTGTSGEGDLVELMEATLAAFPNIKLSSLPSRGIDGGPRHIEFGIKGQKVSAAAAFRAFRAGLAKHTDAEIEDLAIP